MKYPTRSSELCARKWISGIPGMSSRSYSASLMVMVVALQDIQSSLSCLMKREWALILTVHSHPIKTKWKFSGRSNSYLTSIGLKSSTQSWSKRSKSKTALPNSCRNTSLKSLLTNTAPKVWLGPSSPNKIVHPANLTTIYQVLNHIKTCLSPASPKINVLTQYLILTSIKTKHLAKK